MGLMVASLAMACMACATKPAPVDVKPIPPTPTLNEQLLEIDKMSRSGQHDEALAALEPLIAAHPETQRPRGLKTDIHLRKGDYEGALTLQKEIIASIPDKWYAHYHLGLIYLEYMNDYSSAIASIEAALALLEADSGDFTMEDYIKNKYNLLVSLAKANEKSKDFERALELCGLILEIRPNDPWTTTFKEKVEAELERRRARTSADDGGSTPTESTTE